MSDILQLVKDKDPGQREFHQAVMEVMASVKPVMDRNPEYRAAKILERLVEPERVILFRVPWVDDQGEVQVNRDRLTNPQIATEGDIDSLLGLYRDIAALAPLAVTLQYRFLKATDHCIARWSS